MAADIPHQVLEDGSQAAFLEVGIATSVPRWLAVLAAICQTLDSETLAPGRRVMLEGMVAGLARVLEGGGLLPPEGGWRIGGLVGDWGGVDGTRKTIKIPMCKTCHDGLYVTPVGQTRTVETNEEIYIWVCRRCGDAFGQQMDFGLAPIEGHIES